MRLIKKNIEVAQNVLSYLEKAAKQIKTIIKSVASPQFEYNFLHFVRSLKEYEKFTESKLIILEAKVIIERQTKNEACSYYQILRKSSIKENDVEWSASTNSKPSLEKLQQHKLLLPNLCCIGCSPYLIKNKEIVKENPLLNQIVVLSKKEAYTETIFSKYVCGLANSGGGIIVVGAEETKHGIKLIGISFQEIVEIEGRIKLMSALISQIDKQIRFQIQKSLVLNDWDGGISAPNFCYKILIYPLVKKNVNYTCYIETNKAHLQTEYEVYEIKNGKAEQTQFNSKKENTYYKLMHSNYVRNSNKSTSNCHQNILCTNSCNQFLEQYLHQAKNTILEKEEHKGEKEIRECLNNDEKECAIRYSRQCLLLVGIQRQKKLIEQLNNLLHSKKCVYEISKPYDGQFLEKGRAVYLISHCQKNEFIKELIKESDKTGGITMIPVFTTLQVDKSSKIMSSRNIFFEYVYQKFLKLPFERENTLKDILLYSFNDKREAIYGYLIFEHILNVRPYFAKDPGNSNKNRENLFH